ncbi:MAG: trypsin-like peptidase domain-containing protein [Nitrospinae bacterium]|nr:trypsin-like peptidase domain-containing protein [Nitrospinota bacterium]
MKTRLSLRLATFSTVLIIFFLSGQGFASAGSQGLKLLEELEQALVSLADKVRPAVVSLSPYVPPSPSVRRQGSLNKRRPTNAGAGVIIDGKNGFIVTNSHVVRNSDKIQVTLFGGKKVVGRVVGSDDDTDLAVVRIPVESTLPSVQFGDSSRLKVGQMVIAVGNPYGLHETMTLGIISGLNRENINLSRYEDFIQTDASINPGNSGGPLLNIRGQVIGINTAIINYAQNIGFSIPSNIVKRITTQLIENGEVSRGWMGVGIDMVTPQIAAKAHLQEGKGVLINSVFEGDPAERAGLRVGDIILKIGGIAVNSPTRMIRIVGVISPGQTVHLDILRDGKSQIIPVKLENYPKKNSRQASLSSPKGKFPALGIELEPASAEINGADNEVNGVVIKEVIIGSAAESKGLKSGDRILAVNGDSIMNRKHYENIIEKIRAGGTVFFLLTRNEKKFHLTLVRKN